MDKLTEKQLQPFWHEIDSSPGIKSGSFKVLAYGTVVYRNNLRPAVLLLLDQVQCVFDTASKGERYSDGRTMLTFREVKRNE